MESNWRCAHNGLLFNFEYTDKVDDGTRLVPKGECCPICKRNEGGVIPRPEAVMYWFCYHKAFSSWVKVGELCHACNRSQHARD